MSGEEKETLIRVYKGWSMVLITALDTWEKPVLRGRGWIYTW
jgi:hypothetical protein